MGPTLMALAGLFLPAAVSAAALLAAGAALFLAAHPGLGAATARGTRRLAGAAALLALLLSAGQLAARASFLGGGGLGPAFDPGLLRVVLASPLGDTLALRGAGLVPIAGLLLNRPWTRWPAAAGAAAVAASFALAGHTLAEPRALLAALLTAHLLAVSYWIGAFWPLHHLAGHAAPSVAGAMARRFGRSALWVVAGLVAAGAALVALLTGAPLAALGTAYGQALLAKLVPVAGLIGLAALNHRRLTPALLAGDPRAADRLRRSIRAEAALAAVILLATARLTAVTPPA